MTLLDKLKSLLGLEPSGSTPESRGDVDVTVEREPGAPSEAGPEDAAEAAEPAESAGTEPEADTPSEGAADESPRAEAAEEAEPAETGAAEEPPEAETEAAAGAETEAAAEAEGAGESTDVIEGIGPTYADRLADAGIETVGDLAEADAAELAERADLPETRVERWIERARDR